MPPSKLSGVRLSIDLLEECERAWKTHGITKREFFERALRRELQATTCHQEVLAFELDRKECA